MEIFKKYDCPQRTRNFKQALIEIRGLKCECCGATTWMDLPIKLELHHIDGDRSNNTLDNLQLLCANCHSYTENCNIKKHENFSISDDKLAEALQNSSSIRQALFSLGLSDAGANYTRARKIMGDRNIYLLKSDREQCYCIDCGKPVSVSSTRCKQCEGKQRAAQKPISREQLKKLIRTTPFTQIGGQFGVSDNAIRKWCDTYGLPRRVSDIKKISDKEWETI